MFPVMVHQWRNGEALPIPDHMDRLCMALQCTSHDLKAPLYASDLIRLMENRASPPAPALAALANVSLSRACKWLNGQAAPTTDQMEILTTVLGCSENDIIGVPKSDVAAAVG